FDCRIENWWLQRESIEDIAKQLEIGIVPIIGRGTLLEAVEYCKAGYKSTIAENKNYDAEGLVLKPKVELFNRKGERVISKIKYKDF
ncbi:MAG: RNA ligase family protein, partial [Bacteroidota bacterium]|nr:RNA ligase family protein [Bacteroidota bacterium]